MGSGCVVLGIDGQRQGLDRTEVERRHFREMVLLFLHAAEVGRVGTIEQIERRERNEYSGETELMVEEMNHPRDRSADEVLG